MTITTTTELNNIDMMSDGHYNIVKHGESFEFDGQKYTYWSSGLCREVYKSECGKFVIKVPYNYSYYQEDWNELLKNGEFRYADVSIKHNYYEAIAYKSCPKKYKKHLAKTQLLPNCWIKQEFVEVIKLSGFGADLREIGKREDGSFCIFDFDPLLNSDFEFSMAEWDWLKVKMLKIKQQLNINP